MGRKLYEQSEDGIRFVSQRRPGDVRIPNYVYDMWLPLLGATAIGVYAMYCRLERERVVKSISLRRIAKMCRIGIAKLDDINGMLARCGFIEIAKHKGHKRLMHFTTEITVLDAPVKVDEELIAEFSPPSGYEPLSPWLVSPDALDGASESTDQCVDNAPSSAPKVEALGLQTLDVENPDASASVPAGDLDDIDWHAGEEGTKEELPPTSQDPIEHRVDWERRNGGKRSRSVPVAAGGADSYADAMLAAWMKAKGIDPSLVPKGEADTLYKRLSKTAEKWHQATPGQCAEAVRMLFVDEKYNWYTYTDPAVAQFKRDWKDAMLRILSGTQEGQWSKAL